MKKMWLIQFVANALIAIAFYEWLGVRDSRASQLILSLVLGLAIVAGTVFLHSRTFHIGPVHFGVILLIFLLVCWGLNELPLDQWGLWIASSLTFSSRKPVKPDTVVGVLKYLILFLQWILVPLLLLHEKSPKFWLQFTAIVILGFFLPSLLIHWTPKLTGTALQVTSFVLRFGIAYCLVTTAFTAIWRLPHQAAQHPAEPRP